MARIDRLEGRAITDFNQSLPETLGLSSANWDNLVLSVIVLVGLGLVRWVLSWIILRRTENIRLRYRASKIATYTITTLGIFMLGSIWFSGFQSVSTFLGLLSAGLAIALKDSISSMAGWLYILSRKPFEVGDRIAIGEHSGDVIDLRLFRFSMLEIGNWVEAEQSTGRVIHIPNSHVFTLPIANYTSGFAYIWNELPVMVTFESNWRQAKQILGRIAEEHYSETTEDAAQAIARAARSQMIVYSKLHPRVWTSVVDSGIVLTVRYLCDPRQRRGTAETLWEDILTAFAQRDDIDFAYPTTRRYINSEEGKPRAGGPARPEAQEATLTEE